MPGFVVNNIGGHQTGGARAAPPDAEYYYSYTWYIENMFEDVAQDSRDILIHVKDMTLPAFTANKELLIGSAVEYKFAKNVTFDDVKITWYDTVGLINIIKRWRESVWTPIGGLAPAGVYKKRSIQRQYIANTDLGEGPNDSREVEYRLEGSWPSTIRHGDLTYTNSDVKVVEVTVSYDWAEEIGPQIT